MASGESTNLELPFPLETDPVNVHGDIKTLVDRLDIVLPSASYVEIPVVNKSGVTVAAGVPIYVTGHDGTNVEVDIFTPSDTNPILGLIKASTLNNAVGVCVIAGIISGINTSGFTEGATLYVGENGGLDDAMPTGGSPAVGINAFADAANGIVIIGAKGSPTWASLKSGL
jgi:hypothetical protein